MKQRMLRNISGHQQRQQNVSHRPQSQYLKNGNNNNNGDTEILQSCQCKDKCAEELHKELEHKTDLRWFPITVQSVNKALHELPMEDFRCVFGKILAKELPNLESYIGHSQLSVDKLLYCLKMMTRTDYEPVTAEGAVQMLNKLPCSDRTMVAKRLMAEMPESELKSLSELALDIRRKENPGKCFCDAPIHGVPTGVCEGVVSPCGVSECPPRCACGRGIKDFCIFCDSTRCIDTMDHQQIMELAVKCLRRVQIVDQNDVIVKANWEFVKNSFQGLKDCLGGWGVPDICRLLRSLGSINVEILTELLRDTCKATIPQILDRLDIKTKIQDEDAVLFMQQKTTEEKFEFIIKIGYVPKPRELGRLLRTLSLEDQKQVVMEAGIKLTPAQICHIIGHLDYDDVTDFLNRLKVHEAISVEWIIRELQTWSVKEIMKLLKVLPAYPKAKVEQLKEDIVSMTSSDRQVLLAHLRMIEKIDLTLEELQCNLRPLRPDQKRQIILPFLEDSLRNDDIIKLVKSKDLETQKKIVMSSEVPLLLREIPEVVAYLMSLSVDESCYLYEKCGLEILQSLCRCKCSNPKPACQNCHWVFDLPGPMMCRSGC